MAHAASPRSLLMGHQLRREHYFLLERMDKLEKAFAQKTTSPQHTDDEVIASARQALAGEYDAKLDELRIRQNLFHSEAQDQKRNAFTTSLDHLRRLESLDNQVRELVKEKGILDRKADATILADCNRSVQTLMTLVQQQSRELSSLLEQFSSLDNRLNTLEEDQAARYISRDVSPVRSMVLPMVELPRLLSPPVSKLDNEGNAPDSMDTPMTSPLTELGSLPSSPPTLQFQPQRLQPVASLHPPNRQEASATKQPPKRKHETIETQPIVSKSERLTRSRRGMKEPQLLIAAMEDPDAVLRKAVIRAPKQRRSNRPSTKKISSPTLDMVDAVRHVSPRKDPREPAASRNLLVAYMRARSCMVPHVEPP